MEYSKEHLKKNQLSKGIDIACRIPKPQSSHPVHFTNNKTHSIQRAIGNQAFQALYSRGSIQAKLRIGHPGDIYEQEADRVANQVMNMPEPVVKDKQTRDSASAGGRLSKENESAQKKPSMLRVMPPVQKQPDEEDKEEIGTKPVTEQISPYVQKQDEDEEEPINEKSLEGSGMQLQLQDEEPEKREDESVMGKRLPGRNNPVKNDLHQRLSQSKGSGQKLSDNIRRIMEPRFKADFNHVRIHTDNKAVQMNRELNAQAFTHGKDIYFGSQRYKPDTSTGKRLIAHELTHVIQQNGTS